MPEADFERGRDAVDVGLEQLVAEVPGRLVLRPRPACLLVGAHQHAAALLAEIELAVEVHDVQHLPARCLVDLRHLGHVLGEEVHVLHREHRELEPGHAPHFPRPETRRVDDVLGAHGAVCGDHVPGAIGVARERLDPGVAVDPGPELARRAGVGLGHPGGIEMPVDPGAQRAGEAGGIEQGHQAVGLLRADDLGVDVEVAPLRHHALQPVEALLGRGQHHPARDVEPRRLPGKLLDLLVELDGVLLQLGDVGVAVDGVHATRRVPGRAGGELVALEQHEVRPAALGEVVEHRAADHPPSDHDDAGMGLHVRRASAAGAARPRRRNAGSLYDGFDPGTEPGRAGPPLRRHGGWSTGYDRRRHATRHRRFNHVRKSGSSVKIDAARGVRRGWSPRAHCRMARRRR